MSDWQIRPAQVADIAVLTQFRVTMFRDMGRDDEDRLVECARATTLYLERALPAGEYHAWLAEMEGRPVATAAYIIRQQAPGYTNFSGRQAYVMGVYTLPECRRQGIARAMMLVILDALRAEGIMTVVLNASDVGRPLYEQLGFLASSTEMRLTL